jgi:hypothetical protein
MGVKARFDTHSKGYPRRLWLHGLRLLHRHRRRGSGNRASALPLVVVIMLVIVLVWRCWRQGLSGRQRGQCRLDVGLAGGENLDALACHALIKSVAGAAGEDGV